MMGDERATGPAPRRPQVDDYRNGLGALDDVGRKSRVGHIFHGRQPNGRAYRETEGSPIAVSLGHYGDGDGDQRGQRHRSGWSRTWRAAAPLTFELIAGGRSNLTFRVIDARGATYALRRPPVSHVLPTAHDMVREHTIITALYPQGVPVARPLGLCVDPEVNERPFYVMEFVEGAILRDRAEAEATFDVATRARIGENLASDPGATPRPRHRHGGARQTGTSRRATLSANSIAGAASLSR